MAIEKLKKIWMDGELVDWDSANIHVLSHTLHYGLGAFEGIRAYEGATGPAVFRLREHIERLFRSCHLIRVEIPFTVDELMAGATDVLSRNGMKGGYLRPIAFVDDGKRGLAALNNRVRVAIATWPWGAYLGDEGIKRGIRAQVSSTTRMGARSFMPKGKINGQYVNSILAKRSAQVAGYDEAIMLDDDGFVAEATGENLFIVKRGVVITPPLSQPILEGITRETVMTLARERGLAVEEQRFTKETLLGADEVFLTGTAAEVTPVREIDGYVIGAGSRGPITEALQATYFDVVNGRTETHSEWLTPYKV